MIGMFLVRFLRKWYNVSAHVRSNRSDCKGQKKKMIAASFRIVPWRCESLWHFFSLSVGSPIETL